MLAAGNVQVTDPQPVTPPAIDEELATQRSLLHELDSLRGLRRWRDEMLRIHGADIRADRPLGTLVSWTADRREPARLVLKSALETWQRYLAVGIQRMIDGGELTGEADANALAIAILAAVRGGVLLARTSRQIRQLEVALDTAINQVRAHASARDALVDHEGVDVVQGHVQGGRHRGDVMGGLGKEITTLQ